MGGKSRTAPQIAGYLNMIRGPGQPYWEPFVGAGWILERIRGTGLNYASDANPYLIAMWQALQAGWEPPDEVTEAEYQAIKAAPDSYPAEIAAFVGFGCSWGGKWFGGYAKGENRNWAAEAKQSLLYKARRIQRIAFFTADFLTAEPPAAGCLIYCDPPYEGGTGYDAVPRLDHSRFWLRVKALELAGHTVLVSEYTAPTEFSEIVSIVTKTDLNAANGKDPRIERLFRLGQHVPLQPSLFVTVDE